MNSRNPVYFGGLNDSAEWADLPDEEPAPVWKCCACKNECELIEHPTWPALSRSKCCNNVPYRADSSDAPTRGIAGALLVKVPATAELLAAVTNALNGKPLTAEQRIDMESLRVQCVLAQMMARRVA